MSKAKILKNIEDIENSAIVSGSSKFVRVIVRFIPQEQDFLWDMWQNPEKYEYRYNLPLLDNGEIKLPPWFTWRNDCCTECRVVDQDGNTLSYIELPEPVYLYKHYEELEKKKRKNSFLIRLFKILSLKLC